MSEVGSAGTVGGVMRQKRKSNIWDILPDLSLKLLVDRIFNPHTDGGLGHLSTDGGR